MQRVSIVKLLASASALSAVLLGAGAAQAQNLVTNGSFEFSAFTGQFRTLSPTGPTSTFLTGWTIGGAGIDHINDIYWLAADGVRSLDLNAAAAGSVSQTIATQVGATYSVTFAMAGNPNGTQGNKDLQLAFGASTQNFQFNTVGKSRPSNMGWTTFSQQFVATSTSTTISFTSLSSGSSGPALDHVEVLFVREGGTTGGGGNGGVVAPEPGSLALLGLAAVPMGIVLRRRRKA